VDLRRDEEEEHGVDANKNESRQEERREDEDRLANVARAVN